MAVLCQKTPTRPMCSCSLPLYTRYAQKCFNIHEIHSLHPEDDGKECSKYPRYLQYSPVCLVFFQSEICPGIVVFGKKDDTIKILLIVSSSISSNTLTDYILYIE